MSNIRAADKRLLKGMVFLLVGLGIIAFAAACGGQEDRYLGLDSTAEEGNWAVIVEHTEEPPTWHLVRLDLDRGQTTTLVSGVDNFPRSAISHDGDHVLFRTDDSWTILDLETAVQRPAGGYTETIQFLPDGRLLIEASKNNLSRFYTADPTRPEKENRHLIASDVRFVFSDQGADFFSEGCEFSNAANQGPSSASWMFIDENGEMVIVKGEGLRVDIDLLSRSLSSSIRTILDRQFRAITELFDTYLETKKEEIRDQAMAAGEALSEEEIGAKAQADLASITSQTAIFSIFGKLSPDGDKLLLNRMDLPGSGADNLDIIFTALLSPGTSGSEDSGVRHFLYLIDLESNIDQLNLSNETYWLPGSVFSPDGEKILYESNRDRGRALYLADSDGTNSMQIIDWSGLLDLEEGVRDPKFAFSPDGRQILFESYEDGQWSLYSANSDGADIKQILDREALEICWH